MRVHNPDRSPFAIERWDPAEAKSGVMEIVSDDFPLLYAARILPPLCCTQEQQNDAVIRVYDAARNVIERHEHKADFKEWWTAYSRRYLLAKRANLDLKDWYIPAGGMA